MKRVKIRKILVIAGIIEEKKADKKDAHKEFDTCFENRPFAGLMQKIMSRQGKGGRSHVFLV